MGGKYRLFRYLCLHLIKCSLRVRSGRDAISTALQKSEASLLSEILLRKVKSKINILHIAFPAAKLLNSKKPKFSESSNCSNDFY